MNAAGRAAAVAAANASKKKQKRIVSLPVASDAPPNVFVVPRGPNAAGPNAAGPERSAAAVTSPAAATTHAPLSITESLAMPARAAPVEAGPAFVDRLHRFFSYYEPSQLPVVAQWAANWAGREAELLRHLVWFHGPEPPMTVPLEATAGHADRAHSATAALLSATRALLLNCLSFYAPERLPHADGIMREWDGQEAALHARLEGQARVRDFILRYYARVWPSRMHEAVTVVREWFGVEGHLIKLLPLVPGAAPTYALDPDRGRSSARHRSVRDQVRSFLKVFVPEQLCDLDAIMGAFEGREETLLAMLRAQYLGEADAVALADAPALDPSVKAALRVLCAHWNPSAEGAFADMLGQFRGTTDQLILHMCTLGGGPPTTVAAPAPEQQLPPAAAKTVAPRGPETNDRSQAPNNANKGAPELPAPPKVKRTGSPKSAAAAAPVVPTTVTVAAAAAAAPPPPATGNVAMEEVRERRRRSAEKKALALAAAAEAKANKETIPQSAPPNDAPQPANLVPPPLTPASTVGASQDPSKPEAEQAPAAHHSDPHSGAVVDPFDSPSPLQKQDTLELAVQGGEGDTGRKATQAETQAEAQSETQAEAQAEADAQAQRRRHERHARRRQSSPDRLIHEASSALVPAESEDSPMPSERRRRKRESDATPADPADGAALISPQANPTLSSTPAVIYKPLPGDLARGFASQPASIARPLPTAAASAVGGRARPLSPQPSAVSARPSTNHKAGDALSLSDALYAVGGSALYPVCVREELSLPLLATLSPADLMAVGVSEPALLAVPAQLRQLLRVGAQQ